MAALLVAAEGAAAVVAGLAFAVAAAVGDPSDPTTAALLGLLLTLYGAGVALVGRGFWRSRGWSQTPAFLIQFFALVVAWYNRDSSIAVVSLLLAVVAVLTVVALVAAVREDNDENA